MMNPKQKTRLQEVLTSAHHDHAKGLNARSFFKVGNRSISEELVQSTFMKTWSYLVKGGKIEIMKAFLYHVLNGLIVDEYRKPKALSLDVLLAQGFQPGHDDTGHSSRALDGQAAMLLIDKLPEKYRQVMHMRYVRELSIKEIPLITGQSRNATAVQAHRGLERLKVLYASASSV